MCTLRETLRYIDRIEMSALLFIYHYCPHYLRFIYYIIGITNTYYYHYHYYHLEFYIVPTKQEVKRK